MKRKAPRRPHTPTVVVRKLGREKAWGLAHENGVIELDPGLSGLAKLEILLHEEMHLADWNMDERTVTNRARKLAKFLHRNNVRIIESGDTLAP